MSGGKDEASDKALLKILKSKSPNTIAIFSRGEYFSVYGDDATFVATNIFKSDVCVKTFTLSTDNSQQMKYISVNRGQYEKVVRETIVLLRCSVELYSSEQGEWKMTKRGSPGNTVDFEQEIGVSDQAPILAIYIHPGDDDNRVTLCAWDAGNVRIVISEYIDTPSFSQTEQCIFGLCPTEYILVNEGSVAPKAKKIASMFTRMEVHNKQQLKPKSQWSDVIESVHLDYKDEAEKQNENIKECLQILHSNAADEYSISEKYSIFNYGTHGNMLIDSCAVEALELFQLNYNYLEKSNNLTLYNVLNKCKTLPGEKLLRDWLSRPLCQIDHINERLDIVEALFENQTIRQKLRDSILARMPDCSQLARRLMRKCTLQDLNRFYQAATLLETVEMQLIQLSEAEQFAPSINRLLKSEITEILKKVERFQVLCDEFFDFDYEKENKEIRVRVDFVPEIQEISEKLEQMERVAEKLRKKYSAKFECDNLKLDKNSQYGFYFRVTLKEEKSIRKKDVHILETTKGSGVKFSVGELSDINDEFLEFHLKYTRAEEEVISMLCKKAEEFIPLIPAMAQLIATLDVFVSLSTFAATSSGIYTRPNLLPLGSKRLELKQCRHPVIEGNSEKPFIPNDVVLDKCRLIILTGANMGGKSTYLRSAALSILLAQIGSFVPCSSATSHEGCLKDEENSQKKPAGKTVRFGPISYEPPEPAPPQPVEIPKVEPTPEISFESLAQQMAQKTLRKEEASKILEHYPVTEQTSPSTAEPVSPTKSGSKLSFFGLSPFGKVTPKKNTAQTQSLTVLESTSSPELLTPSNPETSNTASTSSSKQPKSLSEEKITATQMIQTRGRPIRKLSHRRQLKIGDPSPLQLSGDSSLPRPAQPSPEKPPQLEVPQGVQTYNPPSQRKYYTRLGREWKPPPKAKTPLSIRVPQSGVSTSTPAIDLSAKEVLLAPIEKTKKMRKRKPKPMETTLVLDGTEHFKKLTAENLQLLSRQFKSKRKNKKKRTKTWSVIGCDENDDSTKCMQHNKLLEEFRDLKKSLITRQLDEKMITARAVFNPRFTDSSSTKHELLRNKPKFETTRKKLKRLANNRQQKIRMSGIHSQPKRDVAISAIRQVQKVRFFQSTGKKMMNPIISGFKPKSILKPPKPPATWLFRIDSEGNKLYMKKLGPSDWQKKNDEKCNPMSAMDPRKKKSNSYLKRWAKMMAKVGKKNMTKLFETNQLTRRLGAPKKDSHPKDVLVDPPKADAPPPSRSLSWTTVSSNASLNSLLDALNTVGSDEPSTSSGIVTDIAPPIVKEQFRKAKESRPTQQTVSKKYPTVYLGMTVARSPSSSTSLVNLDEREAVSSLAQDGSEIVEYVGQEEPVVETTKRRFDPFVRPISALFKAFTSSSPEVGLEADSRSRPTERTLRGLFRRSSPTMPEFSTRHVSSSPTRRRANRGPVTSVSQGSSAEDILALMQAQPDALENMEEQVVSKFPPIQLQAPVLNGKSMWRPKLKLKNSLYTQFKELKEESKKRKLVEYLDQNYKNNKSYSTLQTLITFNLDQYMRTNLYPRPKLNTDLLGKYDPNSLRVSSSSRSGLQRSTRLIVKKIRRCQEQLEKWKRLIATSTNQQLTNGELVKRAKASMKQASNRKAKKVLVLYKFKRTCFKYRVQVTITKSARKILADQNQKKQLIMHEEKKRTPTILTIGDEDDENEIVDLLSGNEDSANCQNLADYDGDNDDDAIDTELDWVANTSQVVIRKNQRRRLLRHYFNFAIRMARKVSRRSVGVQKPLVFYSFISQMRSRMRNFMRIRHNDQTRARQKNKLAVSNSTTTLKETRLRSSSKKQNRKSKSQRQIPICIRNSLKYGGTAEKKVIVEQSKFNFQKLNTKLQTFFECLDEYIDVGTPIKLVFSSKNTILPKKMFDVKTKLIDPVYYTSPSPCNTDSDFSDNTPDDYKSSDLKQFFLRESLESTYHVKGLPGLIYLARLVQERVADDVERNIPFRGPGMETCNLVVYMTPIRRLMLNSFGLRMPDRLDDVMLSKHQNEKFELWFDRLYRMLCYGRGDLCKYIIDKISLGQGPPNKKYEKMDITYQAHIIHKLYKKMMYIENGREAKLAVQEFMDIGLDIDHEPFSKQVKMGQYDRMLYGNPKPWNKDNWVEACDQFLNYSNTKEDVLVSCQASLLLMRMIFLGGYSQDVVDHLITMNLPMRDKLLFIINLTPPDNLVENIVKIFHTVRGLDRLPFVGLGYHADPLRVLFEEAVESGDPQLIAHIVRVGRCLDRRSREPMMTDCGSDHIQKRDFANIMTKVITNGNERRPYGAPTMDEMFPFRYVRNPDGSDVAETTEELANIMECEVTRYMAILELTKGAAVTKGDLDHNPKFNTYPHKFYFDVLCTGCKMNVSKGRNLGRLGRTLCVSTMPLIEQDKDKKRWPNAKTMSPRLTFENYIETLDPTENKMLMAKDIEEEKTDITVQVLPSRFGCFQCRFSLPRCCVCMCPYLNDHMDFALKDYNESFSQFSICNICNHGGHVNHIATWFETEKYCPVAGCDCRCQRSKQTKHLKARLRRHMLLSANMRAKSHLCNPECAIDADIDEGYLPDPDLALLDD